MVRAGWVACSLAGIVWTQAGAQSAAAPRAPQEIVDACIAADSAGEGLEELEQDCPGLEHALVELGHAPFISAEQRDRLTVYDLEDLRDLTQRYAGGTPAGAVRTESLASILDSLQKEQAAAPVGLLERFSRWLRSLWERQSAADDQPSWLQRWFDEHPLPEQLATYTLLAMVVLLIVAAIAVVINELRVAGVLRKSKAQRRAEEAALEVPVNRGPLTLADVEAAALHDKPSLLLRVLVGALVKSGRLHAERSLTHRELMARIAFDEAAQRDNFSLVARLGERSVYGGGGVSPDEVDGAVAAGRVLLATLTATDIERAAREAGK